MLAALPLVLLVLLVECVPLPAAQQQQLVLPSPLRLAVLEYPPLLLLLPSATTTRAVSSLRYGDASLLRLLAA